MKLLKGLAVLCLLHGSAWARVDAITQAWENVSDPEIMSYFFTRQFSLLPLQGRVASNEKYWSGGYWALRNGNINYRWNAKRKVGFNHISPTKERARKMSIPELAELAPSEKYDLFVGRYDYPLRTEVNNVADPDALEWEGICHGWSPATMNHVEPRPKLMRNPDGIEIPFGSSDIKALISYYYAYGFQVMNTYQMGRRCFKGSFMNRDKDCYNDLNAGAFHIVLTNRLGIDGIGFIADIQRYKEVWNHPIVKYSSTIISTSGALTSSAPGTVKIYRLKTVITYLDDNGEDWQRVIGTPKQLTKITNYEYTVETDAQNNIIGGEWISVARPDFLWLKSKPTSFEGNLSRLGELLDD